ncbi:tetratricopeptide repeat protein SKI3 isoform X2 [Daucus carota subsp. sativus]|uniref:tetratricopeptide repeat protein SKI3 isoform X2 n=1 Tax=Daucus carota subsp. sativus TaxID=79200 RepID=UPI0007EFD475|nr:PREDICTED: tetratricopeptide repeat protein SKI3 isoform X2 [Daucus carota subsp. sativus]
MEEKEDSVLIQLQQSVHSNPDDSSLHFNLALYLWEHSKEINSIKEKAAEHFVISAKLDPHNPNAFRYLGDYYSQVSLDSTRALKCYQRALSLLPNDSYIGESICDLLDKEGKESLEIAVCREASEKSPRAFWAFRRLGYLQVYQKKYSEAVQNLQHAIRGYPTSADLWEALGLAYQQLGMLTAAIKSYGRAIELEDSRVFALIESGNIFLMLGSFSKGVEQFQDALRISPQNVAAHYGLASGLLSLSKECINSGAFKWGSSLLEEASETAMASTTLTGNISSLWKLHGDIQLTYAKSYSWMDEKQGLQDDELAFTNSILTWQKTCFSAAVLASRSYQRALHLAPWQANIYIDIGIAVDAMCSLKEKEINNLQLPEKMTLGGLFLEGYNDEFWVALGCLSLDAALKQHALIRSLQLDVSLASAWAYLGKLYKKEGDKRLAQEAFDRARSIDPSLALPWAGMSADSYTREIKVDEAYECCLRAVQIMPIADYQIGLANLALLSGNLTSSQVFGAVRQALQRAPHYPESYNLNGLVYEARHEYLTASVFYRLARCAICASEKGSNSRLRDISVNLSRSLCKAGNAVDAIVECENLKKEGLLDSKGLQIYAFSLWQLGKNELVLSAVRTLASSVLSLEKTSVPGCISFICRLLYYISGKESAIKSIMKMPKDLFQSSKVSFVLSAIHALDQRNQLDSVVSSSRCFVVSPAEITGMHILIALGKLVKHGSENCLAIQNGVNHLRKTLHMYPNSGLIRNLLIYLLLCNREWNSIHLATRCLVVCDSDYQKEEDFRSPIEILGAAAVACYSGGNHSDKLSLPTCRGQCLSGHEAIQRLQKWLRQEPWNKSARYLLILNYLQKAREQRFPRHLCILLERLTSVALSDQFHSKRDQYQKFQLLLCASEICLQGKDYTGCISHASDASEIRIPDSYLFFAHLLLCRAYAAKGIFLSLNEEFTRCLELKTSYHIGWIGLKYMESQYKLQSVSPGIELNFEECSKEIRYSWHMWMAVFDMVKGLIAISSQDYLQAEEFLSQSCSFASDESCLFLCHGAICIELAKLQCDSHFLSLALKSLKKAKGTSPAPLPFVSLLLAQVEGSFGSETKWENNLQLEWVSWPPELRPAELFLQMHLLSKLSVSDSTSTLEFRKSSLKWILQAIHMNPSCFRYWKVLERYM